MNSQSILQHLTKQYLGRTIKNDDKTRLKYSELSRRPNTKYSVHVVIDQSVPHYHKKSTGEVLKEISLSR
jgi:hypothetical protein